MRDVREVDGATCVHLETDQALDAGHLDGGARHVEVQRPAFHVADGDRREEQQDYGHTGQFLAAQGEGREVPLLLPLGQQCSVRKCLEGEGQSGLQALLPGNLDHGTQVFRFAVEGEVDIHRGALDAVQRDCKASNQDVVDLVASQGGEEVHIEQVAYLPVLDASDIRHAGRVGTAWMQHLPGMFARHVPVGTDDAALALLFSPA